MLQKISYSHSTRDNTVLSIKAKVRQRFTEDMLVMKLGHFAADMLTNIAEVAAEEKSNTAIQYEMNYFLYEAREEPALSQEPNSAVVPGPPAFHIPPDEPPVITAVQDDMATSQQQGDTHHL
ncbi:uncharacterized protein AKAME5_001459400 [Lates japonicus]|uniref:Uncharacterized protein n=1 Tax=Lates japonicus TaxID=270547 RepID=A0AAD3N0N1_LATJO|nr:uncharacterized protein AKAME5_001459400 [Lates japonicus]